MTSRRSLLLPLTLLLLFPLLPGCATPINSRDPALYRPAPAHYPPLP